MQVSGMVGKPGFIPGKAGVDYPDFKIIPETDFTCQNFLLPGFYADTFTSCQVIDISFSLLHTYMMMTLGGSRPLHAT